ncbi:MAG: alkaline phosphatase family protein [Acidimicrobiales bacterium]
MPQYGGSCITEVMPALIRRHSGDRPEWLPDAVFDAVFGSDQVVLLVLDGLGWEQLSERKELAPVLASGMASPITSVAPSTTAAAMTSITTGLAPGDHGLVGYRLNVGGAEVLNVLKWQTGSRDARSTLNPALFQPHPAFLGRRVPVVTRAEFMGTGFTAAHLGGAKLRGWRVASTLLVEVSKLLAQGEPDVFVYYDGLDKVAHEWGLEDHYDLELVAADQLVAEMLSRLPAGCALVVMSDHGQVCVDERVVVLDADVMAHVSLLSGEGRFRWLHAKKGHEEDLLGVARSSMSDLAWVLSREEMLSEGWLGGTPSAEVVGRLGDVALAAREPVAFLDPAHTSEIRQVARHGSLTREEMLVPLLAWRST